MQDEEKTKKRARPECRALSLHRRQFPSHGMNRVENHGHSGFAGVLHTANTKKGRFVVLFSFSVWNFWQKCQLFEIEVLLFLCENFVIYVKNLK